MNIELQNLLQELDKILDEIKDIPAAEMPKYAERLKVISNKIKVFIRERNSQKSIEAATVHAELENLSKMVRMHIVETDILNPPPSTAHWRIGYGNLDRLAKLTHQTVIWPTKSDVAKKVVENEWLNNIPERKFEGGATDEINCVILEYTVDYSKPTSSQV